MAMPEPTFAPPPATVQGCRERLIELQDEIASIKTQIATADIERQVKRSALDPQQFHRAKTALRFKHLESARITAHLISIIGEQPREQFKDILINVLRERMTDAAWQSAMIAARGRQLMGT